METLVREVLDNWPTTRGGVDVRPVASPRSFSGANVWKVQAGDQAFALRRWQPQIEARRLACIHAFQLHIAALAPPVIPQLQPAVDGATLAAIDGRLWELATWMPGQADYWLDPREARLVAAMQMLAAIHQASLRLGVMGDADASAGGASSMTRRAGRLAAIVEAVRSGAAERFQSHPSIQQRRLALDALGLVATLADAELAKARHWSDAALPRGWRLGDVWHDHVLFTGDEVTGVIDLGAAEFDAPVADVARLLGSLVGDDPPRRRAGLAAYEQVHPLAEDERRAVDAYDSTGTVIAAYNWVEWLFGAESPLAPTVDRAAALERLARLVDRLRGLAGAT